MLDALIVRHLLVQGGRLGFAVVLLLVLAALGARLLRNAAMFDPMERLIVRVAAGFAVFACVVRWLAVLPVVSPLSLALLIALFAAAGAWRPLIADLREVSLPGSGWWIVVLVLLLSPFAVALAPAISLDAMIYHLRFPEMTLAAGTWAYDMASSASFFPAAMGTLYLPALAFDASGVIAQLVNFGLFVLTLPAVAAIARRLGAATGALAAVLVAALPLAAVVAGWSWADAGLLFVLAASALAMLAGAPILTFALLGLAASIKYTALISGAPLFVAAVILFVRAGRIRAVLGGVLLGALIASPWYATNLMVTGNPIYPLASSSQTMMKTAATWSLRAGRTWLDVWSGYFLRPQTLDEDVGGLLYLMIAVAGIALALSRRTTRAAAAIVVAIWLLHLPLTAAMRLLLPAVAATMVVAGALLEQLPYRRGIAIVAALFAIRGGVVTAAHNAQFMNPLPAAIGVESEAAYVRRNFAPAPLYERAGEKLPPRARVVAINEVRLFRFPRPVSASRAFEPPLVRRYVAADVDTTVARLRSDGVTHLLVGLRPVEREAGIPLTPHEERVLRGVVRASRQVDREGAVALFELPAR